MPGRGVGESGTAAERRCTPRRFRNSSNLLLLALVIGLLLPLRGPAHGSTGEGTTVRDGPAIRNHDLGSLPDFRGLPVFKLIPVKRPRGEKSAAAQSSFSADNRSPIIESILTDVSQSRLRAHVCRLQDDDRLPYCNTQGNRNTYNGPGLREAAAYIYDHLSSLGLAAEYDTSVASGTLITNVVGTLPGLGPDPDVLYLAIGHFDSRNEFLGDTTNPAPGADDNASGTSAVLEAAEVLSRYRFAHTLRFAAFSGEEQGLWGSSHYAQSARARDDDIRGVINADMIAWDSNGDDVMQLHTGWRRDSELIAKRFQSIVSAYDLQLHPRMLTGDEAIGASDHGSFWQAGYPAILVIEDTIYDFNPHWHTSTDTIEKLDFSYATDITRGTVGSLASLAGPRAPDLTVSQQQRPTVSVGTTISYTVTYRNVGLEPAADVAVTDVLEVSDGSVFEKVQAVGDVSSEDGGSLVFAAPDLDLAPGMILTNTVRIGTSALELDAGNNEAQTVTQVVTAAIERHTYLPLISSSHP